MGKYEKIKIIFDDDLNFYDFWYSLDFTKESEKEREFMFIDKMVFLLNNKKINLNRKVLSSLKPFIKIYQKRKKYEETIFSNKKKNFFNRKKRKFINKTILIKYKHKVIYVYPSNSKKYTHAMINIAEVNLFTFLVQFVKKWNKYNSEFEIYLKYEMFKKIHILKKDKYINYFVNYYDSLIEKAKE